MYIGEEDSSKLEPEEYWSKPMTPEMQFVMAETYGFGPPWKEKYPKEIGPFKTPLDGSKEVGPDGIPVSGLYYT